MNELERTEIMREQWSHCQEIRDDLYSRRINNREEIRRGTQRAFPLSQEEAPFPPQKIVYGFCFHWIRIRKVIDV